ncbi:MAG: 30S ribosome-binding factor RbfA [Firmicutes bacterium]|nr:30S ribosome-binding factor RbfA [Bacillota bacterium]
MYRGEKVISSLRASRVAGQIKKEISNIIADEIKDPRVKPAVTTVTDVQVSRDLGHAWVYISIFEDDEEDRKVILEALERAAGFVRLQIGKRIRLRHIPEIHFMIDHSIGYGAHINKVLKTIFPEKREK